jgi:hypothetical protein
MKSPPPPPVDRIDRTVNPVALTILLVCLAGALLAVWLAPSGIAATLMTWMIVILAVCGAFGLLLYAFGMLQLPTRAARFDTTKAIADSNPDGVLVTDRESRIVYANEAYHACSPARRTSPSPFIACPKQQNPAGARARSFVFHRRPAARARLPGTAFACVRSRAWRETA